MAETVIFTELTIASTEFYINSDIGKYTAYISPAPFIPEVGATYRVVWDREEYTCVAQDGSAIIPGSSFIGDATLFGLSGNGEPFIIGGMATSPMNVIAMKDTEATEHTVAIYQVVEEIDDTTILAEQEVTGFSTATSVELACSGELVAGETYNVIWDSVEYACVAYDAPDGSCVAIGNGVLGELSDTGEPFIIMYAPGYGWLCMALIYNSENSAWSPNTLVDEHDVGIYRTVGSGAGYAPNDVSILNYHQTPVNYRSVPKIWLTHPSSTDDNQILVPFTYGEIIDKVRIEPNFTNGDMDISVPEGSLVTDAIILKPVDLLPENIRKGTEVAGICGDFIGDTESVIVGPDGDVMLDLADGNMVITPSTEDKVISSVTIIKPQTLAPENIRSGVNIAGVEGDYFIGTEEAEVELSLSNGDQIVLPSSDDLTISRVVIKKPATLAPENIAKDVVIAGVKGSYSGGSDVISDPSLQYFAYNINSDQKTITLYKSLEQRLYETTGSYNITIPANISGYRVIISCE